MAKADHDERLRTVSVKIDILAGSRRESLDVDVGQITTLATRAWRAGRAVRLGSKWSEGSSPPYQKAPDENI